MVEMPSPEVVLHSGLISTLFTEGLILEATANYEEAIAEYQAAIQINPNIPTLYIGLGLNYRILQVYDQAITAFTRANALNPADPFPDLYISRTYASQGEFAKSLQYAETAVQDRPGDASLRVRVTNVSLDDRRVDFELASAAGDPRRSRRPGPIGRRR